MNVHVKVLIKQGLKIHLMLFYRIINDVGSGTCFWGLKSNMQVEFISELIL